MKTVQVGKTAHICPECEEAGKVTGFASPQGLGGHRRKAHGVRGKFSTTRKPKKNRPPQERSKPTPPRKTQTPAPQKCFCPACGFEMTFIVARLMQHGVAEDIARKVQASFARHGGR